MEDEIKELLVEFFQDCKTEDYLPFITDKDIIIKILVRIASSEIEMADEMKRSSECLNEAYYSRYYHRTQMILCKIVLLLSDNEQEKIDWTVYYNKAKKDYEEYLKLTKKE